MIDKIEIKKIVFKDPLCNGSLYNVKINGKEVSACSNLSDILNTISGEFGFEIESITYKPKK
jgi:hypothetical protein